MRVSLSLMVLLARQSGSHVQGGLKVAKSMVWKCWRRPKFFQLNKLWQSLVV